MPAIYRNDLAYVHDAGFRALAEAAACWLGRHLDRHAVPAGPLVDLGCGSGVLAAAMATCGRPIIGFDVSAAMTARARRNAPDARFRTQSVHKAAIPQAAIVTAVGETFNYVDSASRTPPLAATFRKVARALVPGGLFVFDAVTGPARELVPKRGFQTGPDWAVLVETRPARGADRFERRITTFRRIGKRYRRSDESHVIRILPRPAVLEALRRAGLRARTLRGYDESVRLPGRTVFVATRA